ncbi:peptidoglycan-binding protein [Rhodopseudomonas sp. BR0M22]|uniref:peptidoglycan-binding protein n=1 Tax=Rhodopseudomonas sp. BR0M22 TaxID=2269369 RepID=UPI0013DEB86B|nr:peptidoglycan-binding protein [Rhodopseudomonas sp. BR0M22]NEW92305.1 peptidoglycan-binding protein [Rhodopseudomonas sp. BR0M22]
MRSMLAATLIVASAATLVVHGVHAAPKQAAAAPPAAQTPAETAKTLTLAERQAIQSDLAWTGDYNGLINGDVSDRMIAAIKQFQTNQGHKPTGVLNPQERGQLAQASRKLQASVGWKLVSDPVTGARLGVPTRLVPQQASDANGTRWSSSTGTIQVSLARRKEANLSTAKLADQEKKEPGRKVEYSAVKPDFFVLSGTQNQKKFYIRGSFKDAEVRILTVLYDQATEGTMQPVVVAMSSAYNPFPGGVQAGPPPRKKVEYSTGTIVGADGAILADREAVDGCLSIVVAGYGPADLADRSKEHELALLRIYGASELKPLPIGGGAAKPGPVEVTGVADPQSQGGGAAITTVKAQLTPAGSTGGLAVTPPPSLGFSGAPARDAEGRFAGLTTLRLPLVAGAADGAAVQASLIPADAVRSYLTGLGVKSADGSVKDVKASVVRVICVRK